MVRKSLIASQDNIFCAPHHQHLRLGHSGTHLGIDPVHLQRRVPIGEALRHDVEVDREVGVIALLLLVGESVIVPANSNMKLGEKAFKIGQRSKRNVFGTLQLHLDVYSWPIQISGFFVHILRS